MTAYYSIIPAPPSTKAPKLFTRIISKYVEKLLWVIK